MAGWAAPNTFKKHYDASIACYQSQIALHPIPSKRWTAQHSLYIVYGAKGLHDRQVETLLIEWLNCPNPELHISAGTLLRRAFAELTPKQARSLQRQLRKDPTLLEAYLGFRIEDTKLSPRQERDLYKFACDSLQRITKPPTLLLLRVGQASYNAGLYPEARRLADDVLVSQGPGEIRQRARYLHAGASARLGRFGRAMSDYRTLLAEAPRRYLRASAVEHLALLEERYGDPAAALSLYRELGYSWDYAYLADAKLTPAQLERAADGASTAEERRILLYSLGMRYLRLEKYRKALPIWHRLSAEERYHFGLSKPHFAIFRKQHTEGSYFDEFPALPDPLLTTQKLLRWQIAASRGSAEQRAKSLYLSASYIYDHRSLLFYSPALWKFDRTFALGEFNWSGQINDRKDVSARYRHMYDHECYSQTLKFCKRIVENYPRSSVAPKALYTGAIASEHLVLMNAWWRNTDRRDHLALATAYLQRITGEFPKDALAAKARKYAKVFRNELDDKDWGG